MKSLSSIIFLSILLAISCTNSYLNFRLTDSEIDANLIELNKEPVTQGIFAAMATQLSLKGGFDKVQGLLNQLIADGKKQLFQNKKIYTGVKVSCQVTKYNYRRRQDFFQSHKAHSQRTLAHKATTNGELKDTVEAYGKHIKVYKDLLNNSLLRHNVIVNKSGSILKRVDNAVKAVNRALRVVKDWTPKGAALVQTTISEMLSSYEAVSNLKVDFPNELLQLSGSDKHVRARLIQWLQLLKVRLLSSKSDYTVSKANRNSFNNMEGNLRNIRKSLEKLRALLRNIVAGNSASITELNGRIKLLGKLSRQNSKLIELNNKYCAVEKSNFEKGNKRINGEINLFREVLKYFNDHYSRIHSFIKAKYNSH